MDDEASSMLSNRFLTDIKSLAATADQKINTLKFALILASTVRENKIDG